MKKYFTKIIAALLVITLVGVSQSSVTAFAADDVNGLTKVSGGFDGEFASSETTEKGALSISLPTQVNFTINAESTTSISASKIKIGNKSEVPVVVNVTDFYQAAKTGDYVVEATPDSVDWGTLPHTELKLALGLTRVYDNADWEVDDTTSVVEDIPFYKASDFGNDDAIWATVGSSGRSHVAGVLPARKGEEIPSYGEFKLISRHGISFTEAERDKTFGSYVINWNVSALDI